MNKEQLIQFIHSHSPASRQTIEKIVEGFEEREFVKNQYFLKEGKISNDYLFLSEGFMRAFTLDRDGNEVTTFFYSSNRMVFEASSFFTRTPSAENIQAVTDCRGYSVTFETLNQLFHSIPEFREFGRLMLVRAFTSFKHRTLAMINKSAEERYAELIDSSPEVFQYAHLKHIASFLGITDTSLSRIRREFGKKE